MTLPAGKHILGDAGAASAELPREAVGPGPTSLSTGTGQDSGVVRGGGGRGGGGPAASSLKGTEVSAETGERGSAGSGFDRGKAGPAQAAPYGPTGLSCPSLTLALHTHHFWVSWVSLSPS